MKRAPQNKHSVTGFSLEHVKRLKRENKWERVYSHDQKFSQWRRYMCVCGGGGGRGLGEGVGAKEVMVSSN